MWALGYRTQNVVGGYQAHIEKVGGSSKAILAQASGLVDCLYTLAFLKT
jgi:hypothetical protein